MKNLVVTLFFAALGFGASAQKVYFIYLQSDNNASFYVKMGDKIYNSAASGYLILSNLTDSTYNFSIGFPSSQSESKFVVALASKDRGFLIKNLESGLALFDLQNLFVTNAQKDDAPKSVSYQKRNDEFSSLLSKAANDTSLLYAAVWAKQDNVATKKEETKVEEPKSEGTDSQKNTVAETSLQTDVASDTKKQDTAAIALSNSETKNEDSTIAVSKKNLEDSAVFVEQKDQSKKRIDSTAIAMMDTLSKNMETQPVTNAVTNEAQIFKRSKIKKHSESSTSEGFGLVFYDKYEGGQDTIRLIIPNPPIIFKQSSEQDSSSVQKDFIHLDELKKDAVQQIPVVAEKNNSPAKSQCKSIASNNDFFKLRKNMAAEETDEGMVEEAKKVFKSKCFTTEQIKNLSSLFLTSAGKYLFFDAAYLHVSDQQKFSSLSSEIKDDYYLKRFKALIGE